MSEIKHTPGKWKRDHLTIVDERGMKIAQVEAPHHMLKGRERNEDMEWCKGNARLIAASPELLEALLEIREHGLSWDERYDAVIAKATGATP